MRGNVTAPTIRTPDQLLRVFVSSTLTELAAERASARAAIEQLHLAPVMFELGARPHPPRDLYRAYLAQSDVFVGIYWQQYGWVAPGEEVSGLEDEYVLADPQVPKLIYVKTAQQREERLEALLQRIRDDDTASYKPFWDADELARLLAADLATLLAERFDAGRAVALEHEAAAVSRVPVPVTDIIGRRDAVAQLRAMLVGGSGVAAQRLITLMGPGGIGKTRLAVEAARLVTEDFDSVTFVALEHVSDPGEVLALIARALGVRAGADAQLIDRLAQARAGRRDLIVIDNFEQVIDAAPEVATLVERLEGASVIVTSRSRLRVRAEQVFTVDPLGLPGDPSVSSLREVAMSPAVMLFERRARAAEPRFEITAANYRDVASVCRAVDGLPLAIELAAANIRVLTPAAMVTRLGGVLPSPIAADRDAPARQRTLTATVEWSVDLLGDDARSLFTRLGVFAGDFSLEAATAVSGAAGWAHDLVRTLLELVDASLVSARDADGTPFFAMLAPVREIAKARFARDREADAARDRHANFYVGLAVQMEQLLRGSTQHSAVSRLHAELDDLTAALRRLVAAGDVDAVADAVWRLLLYWWIDDLLPESKSWIEQVSTAGVPLHGRTLAVARLFPAWVSLWQPGATVDVPAIEEAAQLFQECGDTFSEGCAMAILGFALGAMDPAQERAQAAIVRALDLVPESADASFHALFRGMLGSNDLLQGQLDSALEHFEAALACARRCGDEYVEGLTLSNIGWCWLALGEARPELFTRHLAITLSFDGDDAVGWACEGLASCAVVSGSMALAGTLFGAAETIRLRTGIADLRSHATYGPFVERALASDRAAQFEEARSRGRTLSKAEAVGLALDESLWS